MTHQEKHLLPITRDMLNTKASLDPKFAVCANGKSRSPINLGKAKVGVDKKLKPLIREYNSAYVALVNNKFNSAYSLKQMHWHSPSEHRIDGQQYFVSLFPSLSNTTATISARPALDCPDCHVLAVEICSRASSGHPDPVIEKIHNKLRELAKGLRKNGHKYYKYVTSISKGQDETLKAQLDMRCKNNNRPVHEGAIRGAVEPSIECL
ncbi:Hypothetical predicted protein [Olea europaea subsp. europaea]|uniref:Alpha-carbonic anhydrase domain-containing protein n=1 Tax=Olea europaea subsp. europaea TaxID=158383 RepID=A0A8S0QHU6_OLEEU|nr:Hypothetical predicted protein [Olea europaea subsp. europaea]